MHMSLGELPELVMDREAWHAGIHGVAKSQTRLSDWTELNWIDTGLKNGKNFGKKSWRYIIQELFMNLKIES